MACLANEPFLLNVIKRGGDMLAKDLATRYTLNSELVKDELRSYYEI